MKKEKKIRKSKIIEIIYLKFNFKKKIETFNNNYN